MFGAWQDNLKSGQVCVRDTKKSSHRHTHTNLESLLKKKVSSLLLSSSWPHPEKDSERERESERKKGACFSLPPPAYHHPKKERNSRNETQKKLEYKKWEWQTYFEHFDSRQLKKTWTTSKNVLSNKKRNVDPKTRTNKCMAMKSKYDLTRRDSINSTKSAMCWPTRQMGFCIICTEKVTICTACWRYALFNAAVSITDNVIKVVPKNKCKRWGFIKSGNVNRVVPIEFKLHYAARACCDRVCDVFDWFEMDDVFCLGNDLS